MTKSAGCTKPARILQQAPHRWHRCLIGLDSDFGHLDLGQASTWTTAGRHAVADRPAPVGSLRAVPGPPDAKTCPRLRAGPRGAGSSARRERAGGRRLGHPRQRVGARRHRGRRVRPVVARGLAGGGVLVSAARVVGRASGSMRSTLGSCSGPRPLSTPRSRRARTSGVVHPRAALAPDRTRAPGPPVEDPAEPTPDERHGARRRHRRGARREVAAVGHRAPGAGQATVAPPGDPGQPDEAGRLLRIGNDVLA